jgi:hypothetical protein
MSAVRSWSAPASYAAFRATAWSKAIARRLVDASVAALPGPAFRIAAYVQELERVRTASERRAALALAERPRVSFEELLGKADASLPHVAILKLMQSAGTLSEQAYHRYLTTAFNARRVDLMEQLLADGGFGFPEIDIFHNLRLQQYRGQITADAAYITGTYPQLQRNRLLQDNAANVAADLLARLGDPARLAAFLESLPPDELTRLAPATFFGCLRLMTANGTPRIEWLRRAYLDGLTAEQKLFFLEFLPPRDQTRMLGASLTPQVALERFAAVYSASNARDHGNFERCVVQPLRRLPAGPSALMNIRFDQAEKARLLGVFATALADGKGLGLVRLGDGEAYGYDHAGLAISSAAAFQDDNDTRERMWWRCTLPDGLRAAIRQRFQSAVADADIIGVPSVYRMIRDRGPIGTPFGHTAGQRGLAVVLAKLGTDIALADRILTEERCHQILFTREQLEALAAKAKRVVLVSCWRAGQVGLRSPVPVRDVVIPGHSKVAQATGLESGAPTLFQTFDDQIAEMAALCEPGTLVLVGAGFLGKIFIAAARAKGAVALDVGAVLDYLAGYKTRSLADLG